MLVLIIFIFGLIFGSFVNALVWRVHKQSMAKHKKFKARYSISKGRSQCVNCGHRLAGADLIPVLSWLLLKGKCRYCKKPISREYPLVELLTASAFVISYTYWPYTFEALGIAAFITWLACLVILIALLAYDLKWMLLPNRLVALVTGFAAINVIILAINHHSPMAVVEATLGALLLTGLFWGLFELSKGNWIGGGDVKLAVALGLLAGSPLKAVLLLFVASLIGTVVSLPLLATKKSDLKAKIPFGPFLIVATVVIYLFGSSLINWYKHKILYL